MNFHKEKKICNWIQGFATTFQYLIGLTTDMKMQTITKGKRAYMEHCDCPQYGWNDVVPDIFTCEDVKWYFRIRNLWIYSSTPKWEKRKTLRPYVCRSNQKRVGDGKYKLTEMANEIVRTLNEILLFLLVRRPRTRHTISFEMRDAQAWTWNL